MKSYKQFVNEEYLLEGRLMKKVYASIKNLYQKLKQSFKAGTKLTISYIIKEYPYILAVVNYDYNPLTDDIEKARKTFTKDFMTKHAKIFEDDDKVEIVKLLQKEIKAHIEIIKEIISTIRKQKVDFSSLPTKEDLINAFKSSTSNKVKAIKEIKKSLDIAEEKIKNRNVLKPYKTE